MDTQTGRRLRAWNRALHNYMGLYLLTFIWLFAGSGVLLNHHWSFAEFWPDREVTTQTLPVRPPADGADLDRARDVMAQLGIAGEVQRVRVHGDSEVPGLDLQVINAGRITDIAIDAETGQAAIQRTQTNGWGVLHFLHTFTGVRLGQPALQRDWLWTRLWSLAIDAVCVGLILLVVSGLILWYPQWRRRPLAWLCLGGSATCCAFFVFGLSWVF